MSENKEVEKKDLDPELDDLLDSALQDMTTKPPAQEPSEPALNMWREEFIKEAAAQFESNMASVLGSGMPGEQITQEQIAQSFSKMAEAAAQVLRPQSDTQDAEADPAVQHMVDEVSAAITQTLQNLNTNSENLQDAVSDFANMFSNISMADGEQDSLTFLPFMQGMMQSLLSKEMMYPMLKELVDKYPKWLADNKGKVDPADYERYEKQQELMRKVCDELEPEQESDPEDVKRRRFQVVLDLMQKMQDLGQPPPELSEDMNTLPEGLVAPVGQDGSQCSLM